MTESGMASEEATGLMGDTNANANANAEPQSGKSLGISGTLDTGYLPEQLAGFLALSDDAIIALDSARRITFFNQAAERIFGYTVAEVMGQPLDLLLPASFRTLHQQHVENFVASADVLRPMGTRDTVYGLRKDGTEFPAEATISKFVAAGTVTLAVRLRDITARKQAEQDLSQSLIRAQELYETSQQISLARTAKEVLRVLLSTAYFRDSSRASISLFDQPWRDEHPPEQVEIFAAWNRAGQLPSLVGQRYPAETTWLNAYLKQGAVLVEDIQRDALLSEAAHQHLAALGTRSFTMFPLVASGEWYGLLSFHFNEPHPAHRADVRHIQGLVDQAATAIYNLYLLQVETQARQEAERARHEAERQNELRLRFLAMISHELRTPLTSIKGFASTLLADDVTWDAEAQRDFIATIDAEADKLTEMIDQLLDLSRLEAGSLRINPQAVSFAEILGAALLQLQALTVAHEFLTDIPPVLPTVWADQQRITQVLINLVNNAVKFSPPSSLIILAVRRSDGYLQVDVSDQGVGIPPEERQEMFEAFRRGKSERVRRSKGAGLGLAICKGLVEAHGGSIWVQDRAGVEASPGTTISFTLPIMMP